MVERTAKRNEIYRVRLGVISAITAVNLRQDGKDPTEFEPSGKQVLEDLASPKSLIRQINPPYMRTHKEIIEKARSTYPTPESKPYLLRLLFVV